MIERASEFGASAAVPLVGGDSTNMTAGDMLREAREAHGLHIDVVAAALKVAPQKLAALEADDIEALPDPVFARALAASVCRALRIDPAPVLAKLPGAQRPALAEADRTMSRSLRSASPRAGGASALPSRPLVIVVILLLIGAGVLFWLPQSLFDQVGDSFSHLMQRSAPAEQTAAPSKSEGPTSGAVTAAVAPAPAAEPAAPPPPEPAVVESAPAAPSNDLIVFVARDDTWISVTEPGGKQLLHRTVKAGETVGLTGTLPLSVVVGRASGVQVQVRGKPFDLAPLARSGGVARFEVKP